MFYCKPATTISDSCQLQTTPTIGGELSTRRWRLVRGLRVLVVVVRGVGRDEWRPGHPSPHISQTHMSLRPLPQLSQPSLPISLTPVLLTGLSVTLNTS